MATVLGFQRHLLAAARSTTFASIGLRQRKLQIESRFIALLILFPNKIMHTVEIPIKATI